MQENGVSAIDRHLVLARIVHHQRRRNDGVATSFNLGKYERQLRTDGIEDFVVSGYKQLDTLIARHIREYFGRHDHKRAQLHKNVGEDLGPFGTNQLMPDNGKVKPVFLAGYELVLERSWIRRPRASQYNFGKVTLNKGFYLSFTHRRVPDYSRE